MTKQKTHVFIALVLVLLIIAAVIAWLTHDNSEQSQEPDVTSAPVETEVPVTTAVPLEPTKTPEATAMPVTTETPDEPIVTEAPQSEGQRTMNQSGSFKSDTGTKLNLIAEYNITSKNDSTLYVRVNIYVESYSLEIGARTGTIYVNGQGYSFRSNSINHTDDNKLQKTMITTALVEVPAEIGDVLQMPISIDWNYRGSYSGKEIEHIPMETTVTVNA